MILFFWVICFKEIYLVCDYYFLGNFIFYKLFCGAIFLREIIFWEIFLREIFPGIFILVFFKFFFK